MPDVCDLCGVAGPLERLHPVDVGGWPFAACSPCLRRLVVCASARLDDVRGAPNASGGDLVFYAGDGRFYGIKRRRLRNRF